MTGCGKTYAARFYLSFYQNVVALDTKRTLVWPEVPKKELTLVTHLDQLSSVKTPKIIYRPVWEEQDQAHINAFYEWIFKRGNCIVWTDEVMSHCICPNPMVIPPFLRAIMIQGRELGIGAWNFTQRPSGIPQLILSEAEHYMVFDLNMPQDRKKLTEITGMVELMRKPGWHNFWYYMNGSMSVTRQRVRK
jgi:hypothetical protein